MEKGLPGTSPLSKPSLLSEEPVEVPVDSLFSVAQNVMPIRIDRFPARPIQPSRNKSHAIG
jgi:hypothetical protein